MLNSVITGEDSAFQRLDKGGVAHDMSRGNRQKPHPWMVDQRVPTAAPRFGNDGVTVPKDHVHMPPLLSQVGPGQTHALSGGPKCAMGHPGVGHQGAHGVVFSVVKGKVLQMGGEDAHLAQAPNEARMPSA